jgi:Lar family restriction alleviation protein
MSELKPCPFCGGEAHAYHSGLFEEDTQTGIGCLNCGANLDEGTEEKAIKSWNSRHTTK